MKNLFLSILLLSFYGGSTQSTGNITYQTQIDIPETHFNIAAPNKNQNTLKIKGLANVKADNYVALFALTQVGKTMKQTDSLFNKRLDAVRSKIKNLDSTELFIDMVSFVPLYDLVLEKKLFSKDSYNEIPDGFEMKKNLHIHYKNHSQLSQIISICAEAEIYNLIKVDYISTKLDDIKLKMLEEARKKLKIRLAHYESALESNLEQFDKRLTDGFKVEYPAERYQKCIAYNNNAFKTKYSARVSKSNKNEAQFL